MIWGNSTIFIPPKQIIVLFVFQLFVLICQAYGDESIDQV